MSIFGVSNVLDSPLLVPPYAVLVGERLTYPLRSWQGTRKSGLCSRGDHTAPLLSSEEVKVSSVCDTGR
jgi:hypothetical protein